MKELIKKYPELGEVLAELDGRISYLENSMPRDRSADITLAEDKTPEEPWSRQQWDTVNQLRAMVLHLQKKFLELSKRLPKEPTKENKKPKAKGVEI